MTDETPLHRARERVRRLAQLRRTRAMVAEELAAAEGELTGLRGQLAERQHDIDRLTGTTLTSVVAGILGTRERRLAAGRAEADLVREQMSGPEDRYRLLAADLAGLDEELADYARAPEQYARALVDVQRRLTAAGDPRGPELTRLITRLADIAADLREYQEARRAGEVALAAVEAVPLPPAVISEIGGAPDAVWYARRKLGAFARQMADLGVRVAPRLTETGDPADVAWWLNGCLVELDRDRTELVAEQVRLRAERERLLGLA